MRIVVHDYAGHPFAPALSRELSRRGHEVVHAFASSLQTPRGALKRRADDPASVEFREIAMDPEYPRYKYSFIRRRRMEVDYGKRVAEFIRAWKPEVVLSGNTPTETQGPIVKATVAGGARFCYWVQDFYSLAVERLLKDKIPVIGGLLGRYYRHLDLKQFRESHRIVTITEDFNPILEAEFGVDAHRVDVVPNWAVIEDLPQTEKDNGWSRRHGLHDKFVFLYTGTIGMKHNPAMLLELAQRHRDDPAVRVVVISEGLGADWLKREGADLGNLLILPYQPFEDLPEVLGSGDVLMALLEEEAGVFSVPSKILAYHCAGRPLLMAVPSANLAARIARESGSGLSVEPGDQEGFLEAASTLRQSPELRATLGAKAREYAESTFRISPITDQFERILTE